ncbi:MAG TPA: hypothetical protein VKP65_12790 [Rhodothermales bacterium]|nr:hypothetical protein [Rhodothermales bacterium]
MKFFMDEARSGGHPLHVTGANRAATARGVPVFHFALVDNGHRLEAPMWVLADAAALVRRRKRHGAGVIEEEERTEHCPQIRVGEKRPHGEPVADPMLVRTTLDATQFLD